MERIITSDDYLIHYKSAKNKIIITLPQTLGSLTNSRGKISRRRTEISESELGLLLQITRLIFERMADDG